MAIDPEDSRIIFVNRFFSPDISATSQVLTELAVELAKNKWKITVITGSTSYQQPKVSYPSSEMIQGVEVIRVAKSRFNRLNYVGRFIDLCWFYILACIKLLSFVNKQDVLICKTDPPMLIVLGSLVKKLKKCKLASWNQDLFPEVAKSLFAKFPNNLLYSLLIRVRNLALKSCDHCIVISSTMDSNLKHLGVINSEVIPNWGKELKSDQQAVVQLKTEWNINNKFVIVYSGNFGFVHEYKTVKEVIELSKENLHLVFLFIGSGRYFSELQQYVEINQIQNVLFKPYQAQEKLAESLSVADLHLVTLKPEMEGLVFPSKFYNICAVSRPMLFIGKKSGELCNLISESDCGKCFEKEQAQEIVDYLNNIESDSALINQMGLNARKLYEETYTLNHSVSRWTAVLNEI